MQPSVHSELQSIVGPRSVLSSPEELAMYEYDGSVDRARPEVVVFPTTTAEVSRIVKLAVKHDIPIVGRGAGTGLSGGAIARGGGIMIAFARMNQILEIDEENRRAIVQPGVVNFDLTRAVEHLGLYFAPDPSSQKSCTIGGNVFLTQSVPPDSLVAYDAKQPVVTRKTWGGHEDTPIRFHRSVSPAADDRRFSCGGGR
jgi:glycolate oxidase